MTIKAIKEEYSKYGCGAGESNKFTVYDYGDGNGKMVIVVIYARVGGQIWRDVQQVIRVRDGKRMLSEGRCRPCDSLDDAIDVAGEMMGEE